ncbi:TPA: GNAT family N-acetyltransferase [Salmonella enterica subsp. enterica serovar Ball]|nr:GNAT family N-acetyltransferase [Salmonella enterica subsp. enterica serovar Ball]
MIERLICFFCNFGRRGHTLSQYRGQRIKSFNINEMYFDVDFHEFPDDSFMKIRAYFHDIELGHASITIKNSKANLNDIIIFENNRGVGIGTKLLEKVINECSDRGVKSIHGWMAGEKDKLIKFYGKFGFEIHEDNMELLIQRPITTT